MNTTERVIVDKAVSDKANNIMRHLKTQFKLGKVQIGKNKINTVGVFARKNLKKGEIITYYPPHYVLHFPNGKTSKGTVVYDVIQSKLLDKGKLKKNPSFPLDLELTEEVRCDYSEDIDENYSICGDPRLIDNMDFLGHMINDALIGKSSYTDYDKADEDAYNMMNPQKNNSGLAKTGKDGLIKIIALKDINKGEEILTGYGYQYWKIYNSRNTIN